ncbi:glycosyltransferase family 2 protein [Vallitalea okinawensis]|uniref:glycosyltransferase family 2 protein n=1 Tax=Vallitalea okinawensis TaxID=2078660 RepID=UPI000CFD1E16|nr:glycosyltransferase family 2 protein [Vallitalea okinawensis]
MSDKPLVTIITPSFNQGKYIKDTIESVLMQDYDNVEYIVVDGGSTDNTLDILKNYSDKIKWTSEKDDGQSDAINKGFRMAKGKYVAWLNSDDTYEPGAISLAVSYFINNPEVALVYGQGDIIDEQGKKVNRFGATQEFDLWTLTHVWDYILQPTTFFKKEALEKVGYLDKSLNWCMDWELWIKLSLNYKVGFINEVLANSREYGETKTSTGGIKRLKEITKLMRTYSNNKYPHGLFLYGTDTLVKLTNGIPFISYLARAISHLTAKYVLNHLPIRYSDGWIGKEFCMMTPNQVKEITIHMQVISIKILPLKIKIYNNKNLLKEIIIEDTGIHNTKVRLPLDKLMYNDITIKCNKSFSPGTKDTRKLSMNISEIMY